MSIFITQVTFLMFKNLSFCISSTNCFRDQPTDVAWYPGPLAQGVGFHLLCHLHHPKGLLSDCLWGHNGRECALSISPAFEVHFPEGKLLCVYCGERARVRFHSCLLQDVCMTLENLFTFCEFLYYKMGKIW